MTAPHSRKSTRERARERETETETKRETERDRDREGDRERQRERQRKLCLPLDTNSYFHNQFKRLYGFGNIKELGLFQYSYKNNEDYNHLYYQYQATSMNHATQNEGSQVLCNT